MDESTRKKLILAGKIAKESMDIGTNLIKVGSSMKETLDAVERNIQTRGAAPAFPAQISLNSIAAHFCPTDEEDIIFSEGDVAKLDLGVHVDGYVADTARTVDLGDHQDLVLASKDALEAALKLATPGTRIAELGKAIQNAIQARDLSPIKNLSGHGLGQYKIHTSPSIPNFDTGDDRKLEAGMTIAIEPFATNGAGEIYESTHPTVFSLIENRPVRGMMTREVLKTIKMYKGLPFTTRWLTRVHGVGKVRFALKELETVGNLLSHPPLPDKKGGLVSQHEHSVIVDDKPIVYTR